MKKRIQKRKKHWLICAAVILFMSTSIFYKGYAAEEGMVKESEELSEKEGIKDVLSENGETDTTDMISENGNEGLLDAEQGQEDVMASDLHAEQEQETEREEESPRAEFSSKTGSREYLGYYTFSTPVGNGTVEYSSGNLLYSQEDAELPSNSLPFVIERYYNSQSELTGVFGRGWSDSLHKELRADEKGIVYFINSDGSIYQFEKKGAEYLCSETKDYTLDMNERTLRTKDNILYRFNQEGHLIAAEEPNGTSIEYIYDNRNRLSSVETSAEKKITLEYEKESGLLKKIILPDKTFLSYEYEDEMLVQASRISRDQTEGISFQYGYTDGVLTTATDGKGQPYQIQYLSSKVSQVTYPNGEASLLEYQEGRTSVTKQNEAGAVLYTTDTVYEKATGKILNETSADGKVTEYEYGYQKNPYLVTKTRKQTGYEVLNDGKVEWKTQEKVTETAYNSDENIKKEVSEDGVITTYTYDKTSEWTEDSPKTVISRKDGVVLSKEVTKYDEEGNIIQEIDASDPDNKKVTTNTYDEEGNVLETTVTEDGMETTQSAYSYDEEGNVIHGTEETSDVVSEEKNTYDEMGRAVKTTDASTGEKMEYTYDYLGRVIKSVSTLNGKKQTASTVYDANGTVISETDVSGVTTEYDYDAMNRLVSRTLIKGETITYQKEYGYEDVIIRDGREERRIKNARVERESNPDGSIASEKYYDAGGNLVREKTGTLYTDYTYDAGGNLVVTYTNGEDANAKQGKLTVAVYDDNGRQTASVINPEVKNGVYTVGKNTIVTEQAYDEKGNIVKETDAKGIVTEYLYDDSNRVVQVTADAEGEKLVSSAEYVTDAENGLTTTILTDPNGHRSMEVSDTAGLIRKTTDQGDHEKESISTSYEYDSQGNQIKTIYENGAYKESTYDDRNLCTSTKGFDAQGQQTLQTEYVYDSQCRQIKMTDIRAKKGKMLPYRYTYTGYDDFGRKAWAAEVNSEKEPDEKEIEAHKITYSYDAESKLTGIRYALTEKDGVEGLNYIYDGNRWLKRIDAVMKGRGEARTVREYKYDSHGKVAEVKEYPGFAKGKSVCIKKAYTYDNLDRVISMFYKCGNEILESYQYQYDKNNYITQKTEVVNTSQKDDDKVNATKDYTYDALGRLIKTEAADHRNQDKKQVTSYEYDKVGNRTKRISGSEETAYTYNGLDQLLSAETSTGKTAYIYDENGNQIKETDTGNQRTVVNEYDADNRLSKVTLVSVDKSKGQNEQVIQENLYNGNGQRVRKCEGEKKTNYFYQDGIVSYTTEDGSNQKAVQNMIGLDENVISAEQTVKGARETGDDSYRYFLYNKDIQGSTISILNESGDGELSYEYGDFGETKVKGNSSLKNEICYTGGIYDAATELYYLNARYYNPEDGRFLTQDTYRGEDGSIEDWHLYAYCNNNPINYVDPSGQSVISIGFKEEIAAIIGAYAMVSINTDFKYLTYCQAAGVKIVTNAFVSAGVAITYFKHKNVDGIKGWGFSTGVSFCVGAKISASLGVDVTSSGKLIGHGSAGGGLGVSIAPIPYWDTEIGYTKEKKRWKISSISKKKKTYKIGSKKISVQKRGEYIEIIRKKRKTRVYSKKKKVTVR